MFDDPRVWIVLILVGGLIVALALLLGRGLIVRKSQEGLSIEVEKERKPQRLPLPGRSIEVARGAHIQRSSVGDISGIKLEGEGPVPEVSRGIRVIQEGRLEGSQTGDISGIKETLPPKNGKS